MLNQILTTLTIMQDARQGKHLLFPARQLPGAVAHALGSWCTDANGIRIDGAHGHGLMREVDVVAGEEASQALEGRVDHHGEGPEHLGMVGLVALALGLLLAVVVLLFGEIFRLRMPSGRETAPLASSTIVVGVRRMPRARVASRWCSASS